MLSNLREVIEDKKLLVSGSISHKFKYHSTTTAYGLFYNACLQNECSPLGMKSKVTKSSTMAS